MLARLGVPPEVISGDEEARLAYDGATRQLAAHPEFPGPALVLDIGGGSTELVLGLGGGRIAAVSMDIGSVRLTERHLHGDPPTTQQIAAARADVDQALDGVGLPLDGRGLAGRRGRAALPPWARWCSDLPAYDRDAGQPGEAGDGRAYSRPATGSSR